MRRIVIGVIVMFASLGLTVAQPHRAVAAVQTPTAGVVVPTSPQGAKAAAIVAPQPPTASVNGFGPGGASLSINVVPDYVRAVRIGAGLDIPRLNNTSGSPEPCLPGWCGHVGSCMGLTTGALGITSMCRTVNGYNQGQYGLGHGGSPALNDQTNWDIKIILGHPKALFHDVGYGISIATYSTPRCQGNACAPGGAANMFEGCMQVAHWDGKPLHSAAGAMDEFICEFSTFNDVLTKPHTHTNWGGQILANAWPRFWDTLVDPATCAFGIMSLTGGAAVGLKILGALDCRQEVLPK